MNGIVVKDVEFNGTLLKAAQDVEGNVWAGVRWICDGIGLNINQARRERKRLHEDLVLCKGESNLTLPTNGGNQEVLCLMLDFLPLWLAKISITPTMKRENPELVEKLITYQLKAKDVLADAFLKKEKSTAPAVVEPVKSVSTVPTMQTQTVQLQFPTYDEKFVALNEKIDKLYDDMGKLARMMLEKKNPVLEQPKVQEVIEIAVPKIVKSDIKPAPTKIIYDDKTEWKMRIYDMLNQLLKVDKTFKRKADAMKDIYKYMNRVYGCCWEQSLKEYKAKYDIDDGVKISTIDLVYEDEQYRSIFESILKDKIGNAIDSKTKASDLDVMIVPLVKKTNDTSIHGVVTYRRIYQKMEEAHKVNWKNNITRWMNTHYTNIKPSKKEMIAKNIYLTKIFQKSIDELLRELGE